MFIKVTQSGSRRYAQLVESFRNDEGKPRQRTVCTLGRLEHGGEVDTLRAIAFTPEPEGPRVILCNWGGGQRFFGGFVSSV